jgi:hypothetical protein
VFCSTAVPLYDTLFLILNQFADLSGDKIRNIEMSCFAIRLCFVVLAMLLRFAYKIRNFLYRVFTVKNNKKIQMKFEKRRVDLFVKNLLVRLVMSRLFGFTTSSTV